MDTGLQQFAKKYHRNLQNPRTHDTYVRQAMAEMDCSTGIFSAKQEGLGKGIIEGEIKGKSQARKATGKILRYLLTTGVPLQTITDAAGTHGITPDRLQQLIQKSTLTSPPGFTHWHCFFLFSLFLI